MLRGLRWRSGPSAMSALLLTRQSQRLNMRSALVFVKLSDLDLVSLFHLTFIRCLAEADRTRLNRLRSGPSERALNKFLYPLLRLQKEIFLA